ncbi:MAG: hypothetical protein RL071_3730 [Pseudomonadota bacterium]|jgi:hypothetical protein
MSATVHLCRKLRWKGFYGASWPSPEALAAAFREADAPFSCLWTCQPWGPDDGRAAPEACGPDRACFAPSPRLPAPAVS